VRKILLGLLLLPGLLLAAEREILLVTHISDQASGYSSSLYNLSKNAVDALRGYKVSNKRVETKPTDVDQLNVILNQAKDIDLEIFGVVMVDLAKNRKALVTTTFYDVDTGAIVLKNTFTLRYTELKALMAQMEYQLARELKTEVSEIGTVIKKTKGQIYFDLGKNAGVKVGDIYRVFTIGQEILSDTGESYGFLDDQTGVVEVVEVTGIYSIAEIMLGQQGIRQDQFVELAPGSKEDYIGRIVAKHDQRVAINLGTQAGVQEGAYFAVYKELRAVNKDRSFRQMIGKIRITEVDNDIATGEIARSDMYELTKELIEEGAAVEEIPATSKNMMLLGQITPSSDNTLNTMYYLGWQGESNTSSSIFYRVRAGMDKATNMMGSVGMMTAINKSESFYYGVDLIHAGNLGTSLFLGIDIPTPFSRWVKVNTELDYVVGTDMSVSGLGINLNAKFNLDQ